MTASSRRETRPRVLAIITAGDGPHLTVPATSTLPTSARPGAGLAIALTRCLEMLEHDPPRFQRAATAWHARWCSALPDLTLADAQVTLAALEALAGASPVAGARELRRRSARRGMADVVGVLDAWIAPRESTAPRFAQTAATFTTAVEPAHQL